MGFHLVKVLSSGEDLPHAGFPIDRSYLLTVFKSRVQALKFRFSKFYHPLLLVVLAHLGSLHIKRDN